MYHDYLAASAAVMRRLADDPALAKLFAELARLLTETLRRGGKILLAGNGGSAADAQHLAGELVVRFRKDRAGLAAVALTVDTSVLTASLNDLGADMIFAKQVEALGRPGDVLWVFSTSGKSPNILEACRAAKKAGLTVVGFTAEGGGPLAALCDHCFRAPSGVTSHAQECHIAVGHMLCGEVEERLFG